MLHSSGLSRGPGAEGSRPTAKFLDENYGDRRECRRFISRKVDRGISPRPPKKIMQRDFHIVVPIPLCLDHRVDRVLSFFSSRRNWDSPTPSPAGECAPPPLGKRRWGGPNSDEGTYTVVL